MKINNSILYKFCIQKLSEFIDTFDYLNKHNLLRFNDVRKDLSLMHLSIDALMPFGRPGMRGAMAE